MKTRCLDLGLPAVALLVLLLAGCTRCDLQSFNEHVEAESKEMLQDPTANYRCYEKTLDITLVKPECSTGDDGRSKRLTKSNLEIWPNGTIPYSISESYTETERSELIRAMSHFEEKTCVRFHERTTETDYIYFFKGSGCQSFIGKRGGAQGLSLISSCVKKFGTILHEIGHCLGLLHEHTRPDRDDYVDILYENVIVGFKREFDIEDADLVDTLGVGYDYNSIMHYEPDSFGYGDSATIVSVNPNITVGGATTLSDLDVLKIGTLYSCPDNPPPRSTVYVPPPPPVPPPLQYKCGERFEGASSGKLSSPGFPDEYLENQDCHWQIIVPQGFQIKMDFVSLDLKESSSCEENYIEVYDKADCTGYRAARICRSNSFRLYYSFMNTVCVRYHSSSPSNSDELTGFEMVFTPIDVDECRFSGSLLCEHSCTNTPGDFYCNCPEGYFLAANGRTCFDVNECAVEGHNCEHKCENFGGYHKCICPDGSLQEGDSCAPNDSVPPITTPITTSPTTVAPATVSPNCGGGPQTLTDSSGSIQTLDWSQVAYPINTICNWKIECPSTQRVQITFEESFLVAGRKPDCSKDQLTFSGCNENYGPYCHTTAPEPFTLQCNEVDVLFNAGNGRSDTRTGFKFNYECVTPTTIAPTTIATTATPTTIATTIAPVILPTNCGGGPQTLTDSPGSIQTLNWNQVAYPINTICNWKIECPSTQRVQITFEESFIVAGRMPGCPKDQLTFSGCNENYGPYCHTTAPESFTLQCNEVDVLFNAGNGRSDTRTGFKLNYKCI